MPGGKISTIILILKSWVDAGTIGIYPAFFDFIPPEYMAFKLYLFTKQLT